MYYDLSYLLYIAPAMILSALVSLWFRAAVSRWSRVETSGGRTGAQVAAQILRSAGIANVTIERTPGFLTDHFAPSSGGGGVLRLSPSIHDGTSVAAAAVAAHECGHAIQQKTGFVLMSLRQAMVFPARIGSNLAYLVVAVGIALHFAGLAWLGVALFAAVFAFELVTVPVEIDASRRAKKQLLSMGLVTGAETEGVTSVLGAAAFTYIAAMVSTLMTLLYFIMQLNRRRD